MANSILTEGNNESFKGEVMVRARLQTMRRSFSDEQAEGIILHK